MNEMLDELKRALTTSLCFAWGFAANAVIVALTLPFIGVSRGAWIRPMGWAALIGMIAIGSFLVGLCLFMADLVRGKALYAVMGLSLCVLPFFLASMLLHLIAVLKGFGLSP